MSGYEIDLLVSTTLPDGLPRKQMIRLLRKVFVRWAIQQWLNAPRTADSVLNGEEGHVRQDVLRTDVD